MTISSSLQGRMVALPETRQLDVLAGLLERRGASVWRCPLVAIHDAPDPAPVNAWLSEFIARPPDDLVLLTGEGLRRLCGFAERAGCYEAFVSALGGVRCITRGPKPARALRELGLDAGMPASEPTTAGVITGLREAGIQGRDVAVQLYGTDPNRPLIDFLREQGVEPRVVAPYIYASGAEDAEVLRLIRALADGEIDALTFTSQPQVRRLFAVARKHAVEAELENGLRRVVVGAVGPVVAGVLEARGISVDVMPQDSYFMKPMVTALEQAMAGLRGQAGDS